MSVGVKKYVRRELNSLKGETESFECVLVCLDLTKTTSEATTNNERIRKKNTGVLR